MKIAIHNTGSFADRWVDYCKKNAINYKVVNCYDNDIIEQLKDCDALLWHHFHTNVKDLLIAKQLLFTLKHIGKKTFPNFQTSWHFDDKVAQKYLFESLDIPTPDTFVFYDKQTALKWVNNTNFPKVFKLRGGAGSANVKLVRNGSMAVKLINIAFGKGFKNFEGLAYLNERWNKYREGIVGFKEVVKAFGRMFLSTNTAKTFPREKGYIYFQEFIPQNDSDIRIIVIDKKAFAIKRMVRKGDFRASGSGKILYEKEHFSDEVIQLAFEVTRKLQSQSCVLDFVFDQNNKPLVVELSYCFKAEGYDPCIGYWDEQLNFHKGPFDPYGWMVESVLNEI